MADATEHLLHLQRADQFVAASNPNVAFAQQNVLVLDVEDGLLAIR